MGATSKCYTSTKTGCRKKTKTQGIFAKLLSYFNGYYIELERKNRENICPFKTKVKSTSQF